eukprot:TRINITY_DN31408_c0_g1_i1.p2 TRINITY_DN31408_c0_g1~~TRINITY_DN31408_c0_g1_i1.p2  ORF type:complete len:101 (+),score=2.85 TRINITY_DN31408_c0_g1_i1:181-483(+)
MRTIRRGFRRGERAVQSSATHLTHASRPFHASLEHSVTHSDTCRRGRACAESHRYYCSCVLYTCHLLQHTDCAEVEGGGEGAGHPLQAAAARLCSRPQPA